MIPEFKDGHEFAEYVIDQTMAMEHLGERPGSILVKESALVELMPMLRRDLGAPFGYSSERVDTELEVMLCGLKVVPVPDLCELCGCDVLLVGRSSYRGVRHIRKRLEEQGEN